MSGSNEFFTPAGLVALQGFESSGNPLAQNPASTASGLYQFTNPTWQQFAPQAGVDISQYPTAASAPAEVQTQVAQITPAANWLCAGCDPSITAASAANPGYLSTSPIITPPAAQQGFSFNNLFNQALNNTAAGEAGTGVGGPTTGPNAVPNAATAASGAASALTTGWANILTTIANYFERGGLILLAIVVVGVGATALVRHENPAATVARGAKTVGRAAKRGAAIAAEAAA